MNQPEELNQPEEEISPEFERQLTEALRPVAAPEGFADRTVARLPQATPARAQVLRMPSRSRLWASGALAATLITAAFITEQTHTRHEREKAELAQQQFEAGIRITDQTLEHVRQQLLQAGVPLGN